MEEVLDRPFWASWLPLMLWIQLMLISCYFPILVFLSHSIFSTWLPVCSSQVSRINRKSRGFIISLWTRNPDIQMLHKKQPDYSNCPLADETHFAILMFFYCFLKSTIMWRISCFSVRTYIYIYMYICSITFVDIYIYIHVHQYIHTFPLDALKWFFRRCKAESKNWCHPGRGSTSSAQGSGDHSTTTATCVFTTKCTAGSAGVGQWGGIGHCDFHPVLRGPNSKHKIACYFQAHSCDVAISKVVGVGCDFLSACQSVDKCLCQIMLSPLRKLKAHCSHTCLVMCVDYEREIDEHSMP